MILAACLALSLCSNGDAGRAEAYRWAERLFGEVDKLPNFAPRIAVDAGCIDGIVQVQRKFGLSKKLFEDLAQCEARLGRFDSAVNDAEKAGSIELSLAYRRLADLKKRFTAQTGRVVRQINRISQSQFAFLSFKSVVQPEDFHTRVCLDPRLSLVSWYLNKISIRREVPLKPGQYEPAIRYVDVYLADNQILAVQYFEAADHDPAMLEVFSPKTLKRRFQVESDNGIVVQETHHRLEATVRYLGEYKPDGPSMAEIPDWQLTYALTSKGGHLISRHRAKL